MWQLHKCLPYFGADLYCQDNIISATISQLLSCSKAKHFIHPTEKNVYNIKKKTFLKTLYCKLQYVIYDFNVAQGDINKMNRCDLYSFNFSHQMFQPCL